MVAQFALPTAPPMQRVMLTAQPVSKNWALGPSGKHFKLFSDSCPEMIVFPIDFSRYQ